VDITTYAILKKYINDSLIGIGALKGSPCEIDSITKEDGVTTITLKWTDTNGVDHFDSFDIMDGVSVIGATVDDTGNLKLLLSDGTEIDCGRVNSQFEELPVPSEANVGSILQYVGETTSQYVNGYFYECIKDGSVYKWVQKDVQPGTNGKAAMIIGTMLASNWNVSTKEQTVRVPGITSATDGVIGLLNSATDEEIEVAKRAEITVRRIGNETITFKCHKIPTDNISFGVWIDVGSTTSSTDLTATLLASEWDVNNQQTIVFDDFDTTKNGTFGIPVSATAEEKKVYAKAGINVVSQIGNQFVFEATYSVPTIDLPVVLIIY